MRAAAAVHATHHDAHRQRAGADRAARGHPICMYSHAQASCRRPVCGLLHDGRGSRPTVRVAATSYINAGGY